MKTMFLAAILIIPALATVAAAELLSDGGNSAASFDLSSSGLGMDGWTVNGVNQLYEQSFWCQVSGNPVQRINSLTLSSSSTPSPNELNATYTGSGFTINVDWQLFGATPGDEQSDVSEVIRIKNTSTSALGFHFWQFVDLNLLDTPFNTSVSISGGNTAVQSDGDLAVSETADVPIPSRYEAGFRPDVLADLQAGLLNDNGSQTNGDLAWAFQWDKSIAAGSTFIISKDMQLSVLPEPSALTLLALGAIGLLAYARRRPAA